MGFDLGSLTPGLEKFGSEVKKGIFGDPEAIKAAYDKAIGMAQTGGQNIQGFLMGQQGKAQQYYAPLQHMFNASYGTEGLQAPQTPGVPGSGPLAKMYGGR